MSVPNTPGPGRISPPVWFLIDDGGYIVGYRNPMTGENVYGLGSGAPPPPGPGGDPVTYVAPDYVAPDYVL